MANNKLVLNGDKTHLLIMASEKNHRRHGNYGITLNTGTKIIEPQENEKLLGGFISSNLQWKENIRDNNKSLFRILTSRLNALKKIMIIHDNQRCCEFCSAVLNHNSCLKSCLYHNSDIP